MGCCIGLIGYCTSGFTCDEDCKTALLNSLMHRYFENHPVVYQCT